MFIGFLGPPMSGKTTIAALVFAELKKKGYPAEFISERARWYIAQKKYQKTLRLPLTDSDQIQIMLAQDEAETVLTTSSPESIVVADSCVLNTRFYRTDNVGISAAADARYSSKGNLLYFSHVIPVTHPIDANRVHSIEEARSISEKMAEFTKKSPYKIRSLAGSIDMRVDHVLRDVYETYNGG